MTPTPDNAKTGDQAERTIVPVGLGERSYDIHIGPDLVAEAGARLTAAYPDRRFVIVTDQNVAELHLDRLQKGFADAGQDVPAIIMPPGESTKCFRKLEDVVSGILDARIERNDLVIAFGGGVIGDLTGFAAGIARRGVDFIQMPTSLLAQVDSSVGGKTGINGPQGKNLIGLFHQPIMVLADTDVLDTLSKREFRAGYAEVAKYGLIDDETFFAWLEDNWTEIFAGGPARTEAIAESCRAKARVVMADEREGGVRALLNLGHTFGHALEGLVEYNSERLVHGEGVAIGMTLAHQFSVRQGFCSEDDAIRAEAHLKAVGLPTRIADIPGQLPGIDMAMDYIGQDKKVSRGALTFILTRGIGQSYIAKDVNPADIRAFLEEHWPQ